MWWPWSNETSKTDGAPSRQDRQQCWEARDAYFSCLDRTTIVKPGTEPPQSCLPENTAYHKNCAQSWIEYFNQRRVIADAQKQRLAQANTQAKNARL